MVREFSDLSLTTMTWRNLPSAALTTQSRDQQANKGKADWCHGSLHCGPISANTCLRWSPHRLKAGIGRTNTKAHMAAAAYLLPSVCAYFARS